MLLRQLEQVRMPESAAGGSHSAMEPAINALVQTLREARLSQRITQVDLAARLGVTEITVVEWETRRDVPATGNLFRWAYQLGYAVEVHQSTGEALKASGSAARTRDVDTRMRRMQRMLKQVRMAGGLTQEELGSELGVSAWSIRMWESAQRTPRLAHLTAWCQVLDCQLVLAAP